jgi:IclR family KDG regulon transcriptional repressor
MHKNGVQSIERTFSIINELSQVPNGISLSKLATATALNKSTVHRLLSALIMLGYVTKDERTSRYMLTIKMFEIGSRVIDKLDINAVSKLYLEKLSIVTGEAVHLVVRDGNYIVYISKQDSGSNSVRMSSRIGLRRPMYTTAVGKSILAELPSEEVEKIWQTSIIIKYTANTITSLAELKGQLDIIRKRGYAIDDEENELGVKCVGASLLDYSRKGSEPYCCERRKF